MSERTGFSGHREPTGSLSELYEVEFDDRGHPVPEGIGEAGARLWGSITDSFDFSDEPAKLAILERAARTADQIAELEQAKKDSPLTAKGSMGQLVVHPFIGEIRAQSAALNTLLKSLGLPETDEERAEQASRRSQSARHAANIRHGRAK